MHGMCVGKVVDWSVKSMTMNVGQVIQHGDLGEQGPFGCPPVPHEGHTDPGGIVHVVQAIPPSNP